VCGVFLILFLFLAAHCYITVRGITENDNLHAHLPLSTSMAATLPAGAYVIRNRGTSTVIHNNDDVTTSERDEEHHRERQIWWVETSPSLGELGDKIATVYRIGNIGKGVSLDVHSCEDRSKVIAFPNHGSPWQLWRLEKQPECTDG